MALHVRNHDRALNAEHYPLLHYPQLYILEGGYKNFYLTHPASCEPPHQYIPMRNAVNRDELRYHQRMKLQDSYHAGGKHRLRTCPLRKAHSMAIPQQQCYYPQAPVVRASTIDFGHAAFLSSDAGEDVCEQVDLIHRATESLFL